MQIASNSFPATQDNFDQQTNSSNSINDNNSIDGKEGSGALSSDPYSLPVNTANNTIIKESPKQQQPNKYQQYTSLQSDYAKDLLNKLIPNSPQNLSQQTPSANTSGSKTEATKTANNTSTPAVKDNLDTNWDKVSKGAEQNKYNDIIRKAVEDPNNPFPEITPIELKALIWQESKFKENAVSPKGAKGLVQITDITAKDIGLNTKEQGKDPRYTPEIAIPAALDILNKNFNYVNVNSKENGKENGKEKSIVYKGLNYYNQDKPLPKDEKLKFALAAYNGGQKTVKVALKKAYGDNIPAGGPKFEDLKPYLPDETQNYVSIILERASSR